ncbi:alpha-ketoglutarate-dependent dioxygenase AlkB [Allocoleopsis franciscana]|uniref:Alkylated DNA repair protein n=1 Tax=Allocoleopsis franciscana PCC 7113 TaxID=1173027 RepID=K9WGI2_9CYAN|nr:alpha-ketoglutarate-dependent dioxygenase AlkB [Allocoleopsis franciscana]AFZ18602.1 alkylated DNA repair protein [Allocoleopsis franciscana PCC 7113]
MEFPNKAELTIDNYQDCEIKKVSGIVYISNYLNKDEQDNLIRIIDQQDWSIKDQRRIQEYGYKYDYKDGSFVASTHLGNLPDWAQNVAVRLAEDGFMVNVPEQVIVNEYQPGQGIVSHTDCIPCFGNTIITLSLGSECVMNFTHSQTQKEVGILLQAGSLLIFKGEARYIWKHGIVPRKRDNYKGRIFMRTRRISMTFREVLFPYK